MIFLKESKISRQVSQTLAQNVIEIHKTVSASSGVVSGHVSNNNSNSNTSNQQQSYGDKTMTKSKQEYPNKKDCKLETKEHR